MAPTTVRSTPYRPPTAHRTGAGWPACLSPATSCRRPAATRRQGGCSGAGRRAAEDLDAVAAGDCEHACEVRWPGERRGLGGVAGGLAELGEERLEAAGRQRDEEAHVAQVVQHRLVEGDRVGAHAVARSTSRGRGTRTPRSFRTARRTAWIPRRRDVRLSRAVRSRSQTLPSSTRSGSTAPARASTGAGTCWGSGVTDSATIAS